MTRDVDASSECPDCGLLQRLPRGARNGALIECVRCGAVLRQVRSFTVGLSTTCAVLGLILLVFANVFPLASVSIAGGQFVTADVSSSLVRLEETGAWELIVAVALTLLVFPAIKLLLVVGMTLAIALQYAPRWLRSGFTALPWFGEWAMVDVFLLGAMVALFRMRSQGYVSFEPAMFALAGFSLCSLTMDATMDSGEFWRRLPFARPRQAKPASSQRPFVNCSECGLMAAGVADDPCPRCTRRIEPRQSDSLARTWAFVVAGFVLLLPANLLPVMTVTKMGTGGPSTIWHGVIELIDIELYGLATIVFVASIAVPVFKLVTLSLLLITTHRKSDRLLRLRTRAYRGVAVLGRWSMIDIYATMTLVALARFGLLGRVLPEPGALAFCAVVFVTMIAAEQFDPRLMWDAAGQNPERSPVPTPPPLETEGAAA